MTKSENKTKPTEQKVFDFLETIDSEQKKQDSYRIIELMEEVSGEKPVMWGSSIIGFGEYHYKYDSGREGDFLKIGFSPRKSAISIYTNCDAEAKSDLLSKLGKHKTGKSCIYIKKLDDIHENILKSLCREAIEWLDEKYGNTN